MVLLRSGEWRQHMAEELGGEWLRNDERSVMIGRSWEAMVMMAARMMNLFLGIFWIVLGGAILANDNLTGQPRLILPIAGGVSAGWFALLLALYNFVRWWLIIQSGKAAERQRQGSSLERPRAKIVGSQPTPNPDFDFHSRGAKDTPPNGTPSH
jgi:hypothetical protein